MKSFYIPNIIEVGIDEVKILRPTGQCAGILDGEDGQTDSCACTHVSALRADRPFALWALFGLLWGICTRKKK